MSLGVLVVIGQLFAHGHEFLRRRGVDGDRGVNLALGASNVSFGLPERDVVNLAFLSMAIYAGATCAITDPMKYSLHICATDLLRGRDANAMRYLKYYRKHPPEKTV